MFQSTHIMTDDGGIAPQNNTCTNRSTRMIIIHLLCRWNVNKYSCTAIFGNVLCNIQSSIVICVHDHIPDKKTAVQSCIYQYIVLSSQPLTHKPSMITCRRSLLIGKTKSQSVWTTLCRHHHVPHVQVDLIPAAYYILSVGKHLHCTVWLQ